MDFLNNITEESILIIPNNIKDKILDYITKNKLLINIKLLTFNDLKKGLLYDYTNEAIYEVMKKENVTLKTAKNFIDYTYYLTKESYENESYKRILNIKNYLEEKNLLIKDPLFMDLINSKEKVYVYGFDHINKFNMHLLNLIGNYKIIEKKYNNYIHNAYKIIQLEDEIQYIAEDISKKISDGISPEHIFLANYSSDYYFAINKIFGMYNLKANLNEGIILSDTSIGKYFLDNLKDDIDSLLEEISKKFDIENNDQNNKIYKKLRKLVDSYYWADSYTSIKNLIEEELKEKKVSLDHYTNEIQTINLIDNVFTDEDYIYLIGFNQGSIPSTYKDEDFISDKIKNEIMETTLEKNTISKESYIKAIKNIRPENLCITYKSISSSGKYLKSILIDNKNIIGEKDSKEFLVTPTYSKYSNKYNKYLFANHIDDLIKFNEEHPDNPILNNTYSIDYKTYDNQFTGVDKELVKEKLKEQKYSYTTMTPYFECPFKFYLNKFYKLQKYEASFSTFIGNAFHEVLDKCLNTKEDIDKIYDNYINKNKSQLPYGKKEEYFKEVLRDEIHYIVSIIREQNETLNISNELHEEPIEVNARKLGLDVECDVMIKGIVDKCLFNGDNVYIIDYKTGNSAKIDREYFEYGVSIQLPIYLFLLKTLNKNYKITGMYLQHILKGIIRKKSKNTTYESEKRKELLFDGITLDDRDLISTFVDDYPDCKLIQGYKYNEEKEQYSYPNRIITYEEEDKLYNTIKKLFEKCINDTLNAKFNINPIKDKNVDGCKYCNYKDICFVRDENINYINGYSKEKEEDSNNSNESEAETNE